MKQLTFLENEGSYYQKMSRVFNELPGKLHDIRNLRKFLKGPAYEALPGVLGKKSYFSSVEQGNNDTIS